jgi:hypothetical protein
MTEARDVESDPEQRRSRRLPIPGVLVAIDAPEIAAKPWAVDGLDINAGGLGLVLPPELSEGSHVELTFKLEEGVELSRQPGVVRYQWGSTGGVCFEAWDADERLKLLEYLVRRFEAQ